MVSAKLAVFCRLERAERFKYKRKVSRFETLLLEAETLHKDFPSLGETFMSLMVFKSPSNIWDFKLKEWKFRHAMKRWKISARRCMKI